MKVSDEKWESQIEMEMPILKGLNTIVGQGASFC